jgi:probable addiction module antidote protein
MARKKIYKNYEELLNERLKNPKLAMAYLNEALHDEDRNVFLIALKDVLNAQDQDISALAQKAHVTRQNLYRMLSQKGNPRWSNITSLMGAMGMQIQLKYK